MKTIKYTAIALFTGILFSACTKHDFLDDILIIGEIAPQSFWTPAGITVRAGTSMDFNIMYYTTVEGVTIDRLEVWYNLVELETKQVATRWIPIARFPGISRTIPTEMRISQYITSFQHSDDFLDPELRAFSFDGAFPGSPTLRPVTWIPETPIEIEDRMEFFFGDGFMAAFREDMREVMVWEDYRRMILGLGILEEAEFEQFTTFSFIIPQDGDVPGNRRYHFPDDVLEWPGAIVVQTNPPAEIVEIFNNITFPQLVQDDNGFNVLFRRSFQINALMRVYDCRGVFGQTNLEQIDIN